MCLPVDLHHVCCMMKHCSINMVYVGECAESILNISSHVFQFFFELFLKFVQKNEMLLKCIKRLDAFEYTNINGIIYMMQQYLTMACLLMQPSTCIYYGWEKK